MENINYKYNEDKSIQELPCYIDSTYNQHYASEKHAIQTVDVWDSLEIAPQSCQSNVLKYAFRYGKKDGHNKKDLLKILHYTILWWYFTSDQHQVER